MTVFIAHAPQDKAAAESLAEKLRQRAFLVELETGEGAMRPLSPMDAVVGLISKDLTFSPYKLRLDKRLLDAWADGQLVQVKLDHSFAPVGLRDLPAIDASFEAQRDPFAWLKVADALRALQTRTPEPSPAPPPAAAAHDYGANEERRQQSDAQKQLVLEAYEKTQSRANPRTEGTVREWSNDLIQNGCPPSVTERLFKRSRFIQNRYPQSAAPAEERIITAVQMAAIIRGFFDPFKPAMANGRGQLAREKAQAKRRYAAKSGGGFGLAILLMLLIGGGAATYFALFRSRAPQSTPPASVPSDQPAYPTPPPDYVPPVEIAGLHFSQPILMAAAIAAGLVFMAIIAIGAARKAALKRRMGKPDESPMTVSSGASEYARRFPTSSSSIPASPPIVAEPLVFISYARADQTSVDPLAKAVKASGHPIWIDTDEINAGTSWAGEIVRAIKSAGHVLIMCSPRSFESDQVKREVYLADRYKKPLMPVFLEAAEPPEDFEYFFAGVQWLKLHEAPEADRAAILTRALPAA